MFHRSIAALVCTFMLSFIITSPAARFTKFYINSPRGLNSPKQPASDVIAILGDVATTLSHKMNVPLFKWIAFTWDILLTNSRWMGLNLFFAFIPLFLSFWLFRSNKSRSLLWWTVCLIFVAFLPNAPYVLTDIIHLIEKIHENYSVWTITLVFIPLYTLFMFLGFQAYVLSLLNLNYYFIQEGWRRLINPAELCLHILSAIGIYIGRFLRFNSWDIITKLDSLTAAIFEKVLATLPLLVIAVTFVIIAGLYWLMKQVTLGVILRFRQLSVTVEQSKQE